MRREVNERAPSLWLDWRAGLVWTALPFDDLDLEIELPPPEHLRRVRRGWSRLLPCLRDRRRWRRLLRRSMADAIRQPGPSRNTDAYYSECPP
jgi:hypothetical protein